MLVSACFSIFTFCSGCRPAGGCGPPSCGCGHIDHLVQLAGNGQRRQAHFCFDGRRGARRPAHGRYASTLQGLLRPAGCRQTREQQCKKKILTSHLFFCAVLRPCRSASLSAIRSVFLIIIRRVGEVYQFEWLIRLILSVRHHHRVGVGYNKGGSKRMMRRGGRVL